MEFQIHWSLIADKQFEDGAYQPSPSNLPGQVPVPGDPEKSEDPVVVPSAPPETVVGYEGASFNSSWFNYSLKYINTKYTQ